jgi:Domain of unknown function (DUF3560).
MPHKTARTNEMPSMSRDRGKEQTKETEMAYVSRLEELFLTATGKELRAPVSKSVRLRSEAERLMKESHQMAERIPVGQPIHSARDRNYREKVWEKARKASELFKEAELIEAANKQSLDI